MASVKAGVVTAAEVNGPINMGNPTKLWDLNSGGTWSFIWFVIAVIVLFVVL
jgi:hypothetical protein